MGNVQRSLLNGPPVWYCDVDGQKRGPMTSKQLQQLAMSEQLKPTHMVWRTGLKKWVAASSVKGLFAVNQQQPNDGHRESLEPTEKKQDDTNLTVRPDKSPNTDIDPPNIGILWFLLYCGLTAAFFYWWGRFSQSSLFWNGLFSLFASGAVVYSVHEIFYARLCCLRLRKAIESQATEEKLRTIVEGAFGIIPDVFKIIPNYENEEGSALTMGLAWTPLAIASSFFLVPLIDSAFWRVCSALVAGCFLAVFLALIVNRFAAWRVMSEAVKKTITDHDPQMWDRMWNVWAAQAARLKTLEASAQAAEAARNQERKAREIASAAEKREREKELALARDEETRRKAEEQEKQSAVSSSNDKQSAVSSDNREEPIDLNSASEELIASLPGIGPILAKKAVGIRHSIGGFESLEVFGDAIGLKPHVIERIRPLVVMRPVAKPQPTAIKGRIVDF